MSTLCPYCGHTENSGVQCGACGGLFEPLSRQATQVAMGPWYWRDEKRPYIPGFNLQVLGQLIAAGKIAPQSVIRGPSTHQFWSQAKFVPGVAHRLGLCHACGEPANASDTACGACGVSFEVTGDRESMGITDQPPVELMLRLREKDPTLCPACGHATKSKSKCAGCGVPFNQTCQPQWVSRGPWVLRDEMVAFRTGWMFDHIVERADAGHLKPETIVRGPGTNQFWARADHAQGVAPLLGMCHHCQAAVDKADETCSACGAELKLPLEPGALGLKYKTDEQAARAQQEIAQAQKNQQTTSAPHGKPAPGDRPADSEPRPIPESKNEAPATADAVPGSQAPAGTEASASVLCPYCGAVQNNPNQCNKCGGLFEPLSRAATQISMGPWYWRDENRPFIPGFNVEVLRQLIAAKKITPESVLRGPATHQFWARAGNIRGVANLMGICHGCGESVAPDQAGCDACGAAFELEGDRNRLNLPDESPLETMLMMRQVDRNLCPCCGSAESEAAKCSTCGVLYSQEADPAKIHVGPWMVRDTTVPFSTGMGLEQLRGRIENGTVSGSSILRGPGSNQFWVRANRMKGLGPLLGACHACGEAVSADQQACPSCGAELTIDDPPDELGLVYKTDEEVAEAHQKIAGAQQKAQQQQAAAAAAVAPSPETADEQSAEASDSGIESGDDESSFFFNDRTDAEPIGAGAPSAGYVRPPARKSSSASTYVVIGGVAAAMVVLLLVLMSSGGGGDGSAVKQTDEPQEKSETSKPAVAPAAVATADQKRALKNLETELGRVKLLSDYDSIKPLINTAYEKMKQVQSHWKERHYDQAVAAMKPVREAIKAVDDAMLAIQMAKKKAAEAASARTTATGAETSALKAGAEQWSKGDLTKARSLLAEADSLNKAEKYAEAYRAYVEAENIFQKAAANSRDAQVASKARKQLEADLSDSRKAELKAFGGAGWTEAASHLTAADKAMEEGRYTDAVKAVRRAEGLIEKIDDKVKQALGAKHFGFVAGYHAASAVYARYTELLLEKSDHDAATSALRNLGVDEAFIQTIPNDEKADPNELAAKLIGEARKKIQASRGEPAARAFATGIQFRLIERLLEGNGQVVTSRDKSEIEQSLKLIEADGRAAGYQKDLFEALAKFRNELRGKVKIEDIKPVRESWGDLTRNLLDYSSSMAMLGKVAVKP